MAAIRVLLADDHQVLRDSLRAFLGMYPDIEVIGEAADGLEILRQVQTLQPDVLVLDMAMPNLGGMEVLRRLHQEHPECGVLVLTQHEAPDYVLPALQAGARGYILKRAGGAEVVQAVQAIAQGDCFLHTAIARIVLDAMRTGKGSDAEVPDSRLTDREHEVLFLIGEGLSNVQVGRSLGISPKTVDKHRASLMEKLGIHSRSGLIHHALEKRGREISRRSTADSSRVPAQ